VAVRNLKSTSPGQHFFGWWIVATAVFTYGMSVGVPYYNLPFFYDYFQKAHHWQLSQITLGFPVAAILTLWIGPLLLPRASPRMLILAGTGLTAISLFGFSAMNGSIRIYYLLCFINMAGFIFSGPIPHQILVSYWFLKKRGRAMGIMYTGAGLLGGLGSFLVQALTDKFDFRTALIAIGGLMFLTWPLCLLVLRQSAKCRPVSRWRASPFSRGQAAFPELCSVASQRIVLAASVGEPLLHRIDWLYQCAHEVCISRCRLHQSTALNSAWTHASALILWSSVAGRLSVGYLADVFPKKSVMVATYFIVAGTIFFCFTFRRCIRRLFIFSRWVSASRSERTTC
jgi:MFS family permease